MCLTGLQRQQKAAKSISMNKSGPLVQDMDNRVNIAAGWTFEKINSQRFIGDEERSLSVEVAAIEKEMVELQSLLQNKAIALEEKKKAARRAELNAYKRRGFQPGEERVIWTDRTSSNPPVMKPGLVVNIDEKTIRVQSVNSEFCYLFSRLTGECVSHIFRNGEEQPHYGSLSQEDKERFLPEWDGDAFFILRVFNPVSSGYDYVVHGNHGYGFHPDMPSHAQRYKSEASARSASGRMRLCKNAVEKGYQVEIVAARQKTSGEVVVINVLDRLAQNVCI